MLPIDNEERKAIPIFSGFVTYFPDAMAAVAQLSAICSEQHSPGEPLHWAKEKSGDELNSQMRHLTDIGATGKDGRDTEGVLHATKNAWRGMANLQRLADAGVNIFAEPPEEKTDGQRRFEAGHVFPFEEPEAEPGKFDHCPDSTTFAPEVSEPRKLAEKGAWYVVQFRNEQNADGRTYTSYYGPFTTIIEAEKFAQLNPNNIIGIRSIHAINYP